MTSWLSRLRTSALLVLGAVLLYFGTIGASGTLNEMWSFVLQTDSDEGFVPYAVPVNQSDSSAPELTTGQYKQATPTGNPVQPPLSGDAALVGATPTPDDQGDLFLENQITLAPLDFNQIDEEKVIRVPTSTPVPPPPEAPVRIVIEAIGLDARVLDASYQKINIDGSEYEQWSAPDERAAGWHTDSALLGEIGNTVLNGHHNVHGLVFEHLLDLTEGATIVVYGDTRLYRYVVTNKMILPEKHVTLDQRMENSRWIMHSDDERLTLVTCWPFESNTHRLIIVAQPVGQEEISVASN